MASMWLVSSEETLIAAWRRGETASAIAADLGVSRSAVLGKLRRLGLLGDIPQRERMRRLSVGMKRAWKLGTFKGNSKKTCGG